MTNPKVAMIFLVVLLGFGASGHAQTSFPTVGDPIDLRFQLGTSEWVTLDASDDYEVMSRVGGKVTIRSFSPGSFGVRAVIRSSDGSERVEEREVTVASVLEENDSMEPAPLEDPKELPGNRVALISLGLGALATMLVWAPLLWNARKTGESDRVETTLAPYEELTREIRRISSLPESDGRLVDLSTATRRYLSRVDEALGRELTSLEVLETLHARMVPAAIISVVREVLDEGDYAKFSRYAGRAYRYSDLLPYLGRMDEMVREERR